MAGQEDPRVSSIIGGKWRVDALLGTGSMASVYAVTHRNGSRSALKILHENLASDVAVCERFLGEGYLTNSIKHPGIVRVFDDGMTDDGCPFLAMDLLEGETLELLRTKSGGKLAMFDVIEIADKVMDTLAAVHAAGIIHRDLKPQNVFMENDGGVRVLDFGVARLQERVTAHSIVGMVLGTPSFMSPEQALGGRDVDARSDIWALGAIMFALLTGETVHVAGNVQARLLAAASVRARSIGSIAPQLPPDVILVVDTALQFKKDDRWQTITAMRNALKNVKQSLPPPGLLDAAFDSIRKPSMPVPPSRSDAGNGAKPSQGPPLVGPMPPPMSEGKTVVGTTSASGTFTSSPQSEASAKPGQKKPLQTVMGVGPGDLAAALQQQVSSAPLPPGVPIPPGMKPPSAPPVPRPPASSSPDTKRGVGSGQAPPLPASRQPSQHDMQQQAQLAQQAQQHSQAQRPPQPSSPSSPPERFDPHRAPYESLISASESASVPAFGNTYPVWAQSPQDEEARLQGRKRNFKIAVSLAAMIAAALVAFAAVAFLKQGNDVHQPKPRSSGQEATSGGGGANDPLSPAYVRPVATWDASAYLNPPQPVMPLNTNRPPSGTLLPPPRASTDAGAASAAHPEGDPNGAGNAGANGQPDASAIELW